MIPPPRPPRLLPLTIAAIAALLAMKTVDLARYVIAGHGGGAETLWAEARAASADPPPAAKAAPASPAHPAGAKMLAAAPAPASKASIAPPAITEGERAVLLDLRQRSKQLDARAAALNARESIVAAAEKKLEAQAQALTALQKQLQALQAARKQSEEAGWRGLVQVYEDMKPRDAAVIFNDLKMPVLLALVDRMKERKAAPILAAMNPDKARDVTSGLAQMRTRPDSTTDPANTGPAAAAGG